MEKIFLFYLFICLSFNSLVGQSTGNSKEDCNIRNLTLKNENSPLSPYFVDENREGVINLHPFTLEDIGGWGEFVNSIRTDSSITFQYIDTKSSALFEGSYHRFKQFYKGIEVVDGGFTIFIDHVQLDILAIPYCPGCPPIDPCAEFHMLSSYVYEDIDMPIVPAISQAQISDSLQVNQVDITSYELHIANNLSHNCEYGLVYLVHYVDSLDGDMIAWVDASDGHLLYKTSQYLNKIAPTADFGLRFMNDSEISGNTVLRNERLRCYDQSENFKNGHRDFKKFANSDIPTSPINRDWDETDADPEIFQLFWMTDQVIDVYANNLGINFVDVLVGFHPDYRNAIWLGGSPQTAVLFSFGTLEGNSFVEYDIIAHELGHAVISEFFGLGLIEGGSLHEGLSDIFGTYIESVLQPTGIDWVYGDDMPLSSFYSRDLENTTRNCFTSIRNLPSKHDRGEALGHWFFLCVTGDVANSIPPIDIDEVMALILESLPNLGNNPDYPDLMKVIVNLAIAVHGPCSDQVRTIVRAWEQICVTTNHRFANPNLPCVQMTGVDLVCEENNIINMCIEVAAGIDPALGRWTIQGRNSTSFKSGHGMTGNTQYGGTCLNIYEIPNMPFYPQTITIRYWNPQIGETIFRKVIIRDCDGDDPTCGEYYSSSSKANNDVYATGKIIQYKTIDCDSTIEEENSELRLIIYDMMGNIIESLSDKNNKNQDIPQLLIFTYWTVEGKLIYTKKVLIIY